MMMMMGTFESPWTLLIQCRLHKTKKHAVPVPAVSGLPVIAGLTQARSRRLSRRGRRGAGGGPAGRPEAAPGRPPRERKRERGRQKERESLVERERA